MSGFLTLTHLVWLYPEVHTTAALGPTALAAPKLRVFSANLYALNAHPQSAVDQVRDAGADIVFLEEYAANVRNVFRASGVLDAYPYQIEFVQDSPFGALLASKLPFVAADVAEIGGLRMPHAVIETAIGPVEVVCVHTNRPVTPRRAWWLGSPASGSSPDSSADEPPR